jgi:[ribosomal protein S5]-alanine N-acetyltransferase
MSKLRFEKYKPTDFNDYFKHVQDDEVMKYISGKGLNEEQANHKFTSILKLGELDDNLGFFKVYDEYDEMIGDCKLVYNKHLENSLEIGYILRKKHWRKGFGSMICEHLLSEANNKFPDLEVMAVIDPDNVASKKLLEKFNFESYWKGIENDKPTEKLILKR